MHIKKLSVNSFILAIISAVSTIIIFSAISIFFYLKLTNKENIKKDEVSKIEHCSREEYSPKEKFENWETYFNDEHCFSIQYPDNWQMLESFEHVGPYIVFGKEKLDNSETYPKIFINFENMGSIVSFLGEQTFLYNADVYSFWQGSEPALRIRGNIEDSEKVKKEGIPYNYSDSIIIPIEKYNADSYYLAISYNEKEFNKEDREIFEKMYESFNIAEK